MGWLKSESAYDRRIRELEEEAERVRKSMQQLMKGSHREVASRVEHQSASTEREMPSLQRPPAYRKTADFRRSADPATGADDSVAEPVMPDAAAEDVSTGSSAPVRPERLANYLASGSFGKSGSLSRERKIQRNKAIVMLILAVIAVYSLYVWLR